MYVVCASHPSQSTFRSHASCPVVASGVGVVVQKFVVHDGGNLNVFVPLGILGDLVVYVIGFHPHAPHPSRFSQRP